ncbi:MAG UNVERIFIED_CONTAM: hypothetical protein LVR18_48640 [Planctomycetaceae bacterium]|jgi:hypothetical protein
MVLPLDSVADGKIALTSSAELFGLVGLEGLNISGTSWWRRANKLGRMGESHHLDTGRFCHRELCKWQRGAEIRWFSGDFGGRDRILNVAASVIATKTNSGRY